MKYTKPSYEIQSIETRDIILVSAIGSNEVTVNEVSSTQAQVSTSLKSILGSLYN